MPVLLALVLFLGCDRGWFLIAGQSNAVGGSSQSTQPATGQVFRAATLDWWHSIADPEVHAAPGEDRSSAWPSFAGHRLGYEGLIATAVGGSCLLDWPGDPKGRSARWNPDTGDLYARAYAAWQLAGAPPLRAVLWFQGECDAQGAHNAGLSDAETRDRYLQALLELADAVNRDFQAPLVAAPISLRECDWDNPDCENHPDAPSRKAIPVHDAILAAAYLHKGIIRGPLSDDLRIMPDKTHIWDVNELGARWAAVAAEAGL